jgi:hypothetical protein
MQLTGENRSTRGKTCPSATLSTTNPTWTDTGFFFLLIPGFSPLIHFYSVLILFRPFVSLTVHNRLFTTQHKHPCPRCCCCFFILIPEVSPLIPFLFCINPFSSFSCHLRSTTVFLQHNTNIHANICALLSCALSTDP